MWLACYPRKILARLFSPSLNKLSHSNTAFLGTGRKKMNSQRNTLDLMTLSSATKLEKEDWSNAEELSSLLILLRFILAQ